MSSSKILLGLLAGVAAGSIIALLTTTDEGKKIRRTITRKGDRYAEDLKDSFNNFLDSVSDKYDNVKEEATDHYKAAQNRLDKKIVF